MRDFPGFGRYANIPDFRTVYLFIFIYSKQKSNIKNIYTKLFYFYDIESMYSIKHAILWNAKLT